MYKSNKILFLKIFIFFLITVLILVLDIYSKQWIMNNYLLREKKIIFPFINFLYTYNPGAAFSLCSITYSCNSIIILLICVISIITVLVMMYFSNICIYNFVFFSFIIGGALGNISNRIIYGVVIDFIDIYISEWHFPTFNIADYAICIGTIKIVYRDVLFLKK